MQRDAETDDAGAERPGSDGGPPAGDILEPEEWLYWCPDCELGFDYDKKTTVKKVGNTTVSCCPRCKTTQIQAWEDHVSSILAAAME